MRGRRSGPLPGENALPFDVEPEPSGEPGGLLAGVEVSTVGAALAVDPDPVPVPVVSVDEVGADVSGVGGWAPAAAAEVTAAGRSARSASARRAGRRAAGPGGRGARPVARAAGSPVLAGDDGAVTAAGVSESDAVGRWVAAQLARAPAPSAARVASIVDVLTALADGETGEPSAGRR